MAVKQVDNVLDLLEFFATRKSPATLSEISVGLNWPRSSTFNLLGTLTARGFLYEPQMRGGYFPSPRWSELIRDIESAQPIPASLYSMIKALSERTGETAALIASAGTMAVFVVVDQPAQPIRYAAQVGKMVPIHITATGRALLSLLSDKDRSALLTKAKFERYTATTLMSVEDVEAEIRRSRLRGWFESAAEFTDDLGGVAIPLALDQRHFAVLIGGPIHRIKPRYEEIAKELKMAIQEFVGVDSGAHP